MSTLSRASDYEYSVILGGRLGVGKTSLYSRILRDSVPEEPRSPTGQYEDGLERGVYSMTVDGQEVKVSLWDTGGLERYTAMTGNYFRNCHGVILAYSLEEEDTLFILRDWLTETRSLNSESVVPALWGNKCDSDNGCVTEEMALAFSTENAIPAELVARVSALTGEGVKIAFEALIQTIHTQRGGSSEQEKGMTLEPLIDPSLQAQRGTRCTC